MISPDRNASTHHDQRSQQDKRSGDTHQQSLGAELSEVDLPQGQVPTRIPQGVSFLKVVDGIPGYGRHELELT